MLVELLRKEFLQGLAFETGDKKKFLLSLLGKALLAVLFVTLECYIFLSLDKKIEDYSRYGTFDFLVFFLFIFMLAGTFLSAYRARQVLFDRGDSAVSLPLPIDSSSIILSKMIYIYLREALTSLLVATPLLICYGATRLYMPYYYVFSIIYPFVITLFSSGLSLLLALPFEGLYRLIKDRPLWQFLLASAIVVGLCFLYQKVLQMFLTALSDSSVGGVFDEGFIEGIHKAASYFVPVISYLSILAVGSSLSTHILFLLGSLLFGLALSFIVSDLSYAHFVKADAEIASSKPKKERKPRKKPSLFQMLLRKELALLFYGTDNLFGYTALLVMIPFLSFLVISSLNAIVYSSLEIFTVYFPELPNALNIGLLLLFSSVSVSGASFGIEREGKALVVLKTLPLDPSKVLFAKLLPPFALSALSLLLSLLALRIGNVIPWSVFGIVLYLGLVSLAFNLVLGLLLDMGERKANGHDLSFLAPLFSIGFPLLVLFVHAGLSLSAIPAACIYLVEFVLGLCLLPYILWRLPSRLDKAFELMEVSA